MRAIQIVEFGGPEVLKQVDLPTPEPGPEEVLIEVSRAGVNFADTHTRDQLLRAQGHSAARARRRGGGRRRLGARRQRAERRPARDRAHRPGRLCRVRERPERPHVRGARGRRRRHRSRPHHPGHNRLAPLSHGRPRGRGRERGRALRRRGRRLAGGPARAFVRSPPGDRGRLQRREARLGARTWRRRRDRRGCRGSDRAPGRRPTADARSTSYSTWPAARLSSAPTELWPTSGGSSSAASPRRNPTASPAARCCVTRVRSSASTCSTASSVPGCSPKL